jgi:hypothetical protein
MPTYLCKNCLFRPDGGVEGRRQVPVRSSGTYPQWIDGNRRSFYSHSQSPEADTNRMQHAHEKESACLYADTAVPRNK